MIDVARVEIALEDLIQVAELAARVISAGDEASPLDLLLARQRLLDAADRGRWARLPHAPRLGMPPEPANDRRGR